MKFIHAFVKEEVIKDVLKENGLSENPRLLFISENEVQVSGLKIKHPVPDPASLKWTPAVEKEQRMVSTFWLRKWATQKRILQNQKASLSRQRKNLEKEKNILNRGSRDTNSPEEIKRIKEDKKRVGGLLAQNYRAIQSIDHDIFSGNSKAGIGLNENKGQRQILEFDQQHQYNDQKRAVDVDLSNLKGKIAYFVGNDQGAVFLNAQTTVSSNSLIY
jgi:hypothetical protein